MKDNSEDFSSLFLFRVIIPIRGDFMNIKYEDLFNEEDGLLSISRDDFRYVMSGKDIFYKIININKRKDAVDEIKKSFERETLHKNSTIAIVYVESKDNLTLIEQARMIEAIRELYEDDDEEKFIDLNVIYGCAINEDLNSEVKITYLSSTIDEIV